MKRTVNIVVIIIFVFTMTLPLIFSDKIGGKKSDDENRMLAEFPQIFTSNGVNIDIIPSFEKWANDNIGFRRYAVQLSTVIRYSLFDTDPTSDMLKGKNDWLYYYDNNIIKDFQHLNTSDTEQLNRRIDSYKALKGYLDKQDIPLITVLLPDKKTVYPEYYPEGILQTENESRSSILEKNFKNAGMDFIYPLPNLLKAKEDEVVYSPRIDNAHWNIYGAFIGYKTIMERVKNYFPNIVALDFSDYTITEYEASRNLNGIISLKEPSYNFAPKFSPAAKLSGDEYWKDKPLLQAEHIRYENSNENLPKILVIGDSYFYGSSILPIFAESFSELVFIHNFEAEKISDYVSIEKPDIVIYETVERMFDGAADSLVNWQNNVLPNISYEDDAMLSLPVKDNIQEMYNGMIVDAVNGRTLEEQGKIEMLKTDTGVSLYGWAADFNAKLPASALYVKAGDNIYKTRYGVSRTSVSDYYKDEALENTGFEIDLPLEVLNEKVINFIIISNDGTYRYKDIPYSIVIKAEAN